MSEPKTALQFKTAVRQGIIPLIGVYGMSGSGKTFSACTLARGYVGPQGRIAVIDTENGRANIVSDQIPGGFKVLDLDEPFSPARYLEALSLAENDFDIVVIDSLTHGWDSAGGVLGMQEAELERMAGSDWKKREACKFTAWIKPKAEHKKLVARILRFKIPIICCLRGQPKVHMDKDKDGKTIVFTDRFSSPIYDSKFIFEMLANLETIEGEQGPGYCHVAKFSHPGLLACLPKPNERISEKHGAAIAAWCKGAPVVSSTAPANIAALKKELWKITKPIHGGDKATLESWLINEALIDPDMMLDSLTETQLPGIISKAKTKLTK